MLISSQYIVVENRGGGTGVGGGGVEVNIHTSDKKLRAS